MLLTPSAFVHRTMLIRQTRASVSCEGGTSTGQLRSPRTQSFPTLILSTLAPCVPLSTCCLYDVNTEEAWLTWEIQTQNIKIPRMLQLTSVGYMHMISSKPAPPPATRFFQKGGGGAAFWLARRCVGLPSRGILQGWKLPHGLLLQLAVFYYSVGAAISIPSKRRWIRNGQHGRNRRRG